MDPPPNTTDRGDASTRQSAQTSKQAHPQPKSSIEQPKPVRKMSASDKSDARKRKASRSPERSPARSLDDSDRAHGTPANISIRKRRQTRKNEIKQKPLIDGISDNTNPLKVLAHAASSKSHILTPISLTTPNRRLVLLNSPFPSPLVQQSRFDLFGALMSHVDVLLNITSYLSPQTLLDLYSVSAPFHYMMDSHFTSFIMACTCTWAPNADQCYPWWCYRQLCIEDPALRRARTTHDKRSLSWTDKQGKPHRSMTEALNAAQDENPQQGSRKRSDEHAKIAVSVKAVPSFRWLKMVSFRESVTREIVGWMATHGHHVPRDHAVEALKKTWFLLDMPVNAPRIALIHNKAYFSDDNLFILQMVFIKLDMLYQDPIHHYGGEWTMREFLLAERGLTTLWNYLRGADGTSRLDIVRLWIKHGYRRPNPARPMTEDEQVKHDRKQTLPIMGVPPALVGRWGFECWGLGKIPLLRPDELVMREGVRRRLELQRFYLRMIAAGYMDEQLRPIPTPEPDQAVLSLIRRRKNKELADRGKQKPFKSRDRESTGSIKGDGGNEDVDVLQDLVLASLNGQA